jgi:hypothetical protein
MILLEDVKRIAEKATGWKRPDNPQALLRERIGVERLRQPHRAFVDDKRPFGSRMTASFPIIRTRRHLRLCPLSFAHPRGPRHRVGQRQGEIRRN